MNSYFIIAYYLFVLFRLNFLTEHNLKVLTCVGRALCNFLHVYPISREKSDESHKSKNILEINHFCMPLFAQQHVTVIEDEGQSLYDDIYLFITLNSVLKLDVKLSAFFVSFTGYGYFLTSVSPQDQITVSSDIDVLLRLGGSNPSPVHTPFLCYALAPKCRRRQSYDVRPCKEACKQFVVMINTYTLLKCTFSALSAKSLHMKSLRIRVNGP